MEGTTMMMMRRRRRSAAHGLSIQPLGSDLFAACGRVAQWRCTSERGRCFARPVVGRTAYMSPRFVARVTGKSIHGGSITGHYNLPFMGATAAFRASRGQARKAARSLSNQVGDGSKQQREDERGCLYVRRTIHSGERIEHSGTVIVKGDVKPGAAIWADGDIIVLGLLQGEVHAGKSGDRSASVFALQMEPTDIGIAESANLGPERCSVNAKFASLSDGKIGLRSCLENNCSTLSKIARAFDKRQRSRMTERDGISLMKPAWMSLLTGSYISAIGLVLFLFPTHLFGILFDLQSVTSGWIRVGSVLAMVFGVYYIGTGFGDVKGYNGAHSFYMSTVVGRVFLFFSFCWLVGTGAAPPPLLIIGAVNLIGAVLMLRALQEANVQPSGAVKV